MQFSRYLKFWGSLVNKEKIIDQHYKSIYEVDYQQLREQHELIIFDYDDTLTCMHGDLPEATLLLLKHIQSLGFRVGVVSNCGYNRYLKLQEVFSKLDIYISPNRNKPSPEGFKNVAEHYQIPLIKAVSIGDRLGTECFGAKLAGVNTIYLIDKYSAMFKCSKSIPPLNWLDKLERKIYFRGQRRV